MQWLRLSIFDVDGELLENYRFDGKQTFKAGPNPKVAAGLVSWLLKEAVLYTMITRSMTYA